MCLRIYTGFKGVSFRESHLWEHFGRRDKIALITCLKKLNVSGASLSSFPGKERLFQGITSEIPNFSEIIISE